MSLYPIFAPPTSIVPATVTMPGAPYTTGANQAEYTTGGLSIGADEADRTVIVSVAGMGYSTSARISAVTIGGVTATRIGAEAVIGEGQVVLYKAVCSGTTAVVVATLTSTQGSMCIAAWDCRGISGTETSTSVDTGANLAGTVDVPAGGICIMAMVSQSTADFGWTNLTEDYDSVMQTGFEASGASEAFAAAQSSLVVSVDNADSAQSCSTVVSFGPV
jgi:hypothetical protein